MIKKSITMLCVVLFLFVNARAETIFEEFDTDPTASDWVDAGDASTRFTYSAEGYLDAVISRDSANPARYYTMLENVYSQSQEFWFEMDLRLIASDTDYQVSQFGVFDYNTADNSHNFVGDRFAYKQASGTTRYNRNDVYGYASDGTAATAASTIDDGNGIAFGQDVRVKGHYWYESGLGKETLSVYKINSDGTTGSLIMHSGTATVIGSGKSLSFDLFGLNNRDDSTLLSNNRMKVDNLYFSTTGSNASPVKPSFALAAVATSPSPADLGAEVSATADLSWTAGSGATSHDVYFGTTTSPTFQGNQTGTTFDPGTMSSGTIYYWRIGEKNNAGTNLGPLWKFTTRSTSTIFETFTVNPTSRGWASAGAGSTTFNYNNAGSGYLDAVLVRNSTAIANYYKRIGAVYSKTQEFWFEMDYQPVSANTDYQAGLAGAFDYNSTDNDHNVTGCRFSYKQYSGTTRYNRNDIDTYTSDGVGTTTASTIDDTGHIAFGDDVRAKIHYWYDSGAGVGKENINVYLIDADGSTGSLVQHCADTTVVASGKSRQIDMFGVGNRTDGTASGNNVCKVDNLYFSTTGANGKYFRPFGGYEVTTISDVSYLSAGRTEKLDLYYPSDAPAGMRFPGVVLIHGGGWTGGDKVSDRELNIANSLAAAGYVCVSINYDLAAAGSPSWPTCLTDCKTAVQFLRYYADTYDVDANNIGVIGGSAGGHLAAMVGLTQSSDGLEPSVTPYSGVSTSVKAIVSMYAITNQLSRQETDASGNPTGVLKDGTAPTLLGVSRTNDPNDLWEASSPVNYIDANDPPVLVLHGLADTTVDYQQSVELARKLGIAGVAYKSKYLSGVDHTFSLQYNSAGSPLPEDLRPIAIGFFDKYLKGIDGAY